MNYLNDIISAVSYPDAPVTDICTGAFWTTVTSKYSGLATTYRDLDQHHNDIPSMVPNAGKLFEKMPTAGELAQLLLSENTVAAAIGIAAINSALEVNEDACEVLNASDVAAEKGAGKNIAVIGHFPFAKKLKPIAKNLWIIEKRDVPGDEPEAAAAHILPQCDVVCMTGTTLINHTFAEMMALCRKDAYVILTGPSSPLHPVLFDYGVDVISGCRVTDVKHVNRYITQGATLRQLKHAGVNLISMRKETYTA